MLSPNPNSQYQTYDITEDQELEGRILNPTQTAILQNLRVEIIEQKLSLTPTSMSPEGKESYWQQEAYLRGQLDILEHMLQASAASLKQLQESN